MPPEPDNKMDDLLKAYAKKRRDEAGAPMAMHPATRRLLQSEVAKLKPASAAEPKSWLTSLWMFWPRIAFAAAIVVVGGIAVFSLYPPEGAKKNEVFFAKQDAESMSRDRYIREERDAAPLRSLAPAASAPAKPVDQPTVALSDEAKAADFTLRANSPTPVLAIADDRVTTFAEKNEALAKSQQPAPMPMRRSSAASGPVPSAPLAPVSEPAALGATLADSRAKDVTSGKELKAETSLAEATRLAGAAVADKKKVDELAVATTSSPATALPAPADPASRGAAASAAEFNQQPNNAAARGYFIQAQPAARPVLDKALPNSEATVLSRFSVEQQGEVVRVVDGDGSVYEGKVVTGDAASRTELEDLAGTRATRQDDSLLRQKVAEQQVQQQQAQTQFRYQLADGQAPSVWNFRARGTNRTLKQPVTIDAVVFNGVVVTNSTGGVAGAGNAGQSLNFYRNTPGQTPQNANSITTQPSQVNGGAALQNNAYGNQPLHLNNALRIQGNYRIGPTNQRPLDALRDGEPRQ